MKNIYSLVVISENKIAIGKNKYTKPEAIKKIWEVSEKLPKTAHIVLMRNGKIAVPSAWQFLKRAINLGTGMSLWKEIQQ